MRKAAKTKKEKDIKGSVGREACRSEEKWHTEEQRQNGGKKQNLYGGREGKFGTQV